MTRAARAEKAAEKAQKSRSEVALEDRVADLERRIGHIIGMQKALDASVEKVERMLERWAKIR